MRPEAVDGYIITWTVTNLPELEARRMVRLDDVHFRSTHDDEHGVYTLAETFFVHQLPAYIRVEELLKAQQYYYQMMLASIQDELGSIDRMIEEARKEDK